MRLGRSGLQYATHLKQDTGATSLCFQNVRHYMSVGRLNSIKYFIIFIRYYMICSSRRGFAPDPPLWDTLNVSKPFIIIGSLTSANL